MVMIIVSAMSKLSGFLFFDVNLFYPKSLMLPLDCQYCDDNLDSGQMRIKSRELLSQ
jgi:hypothetical protein